VKARPEFRGVYDKQWNVFSDFSRYPAHKILNRGTMYVTPDSLHLGQITDRGNWDFEVMTGATEGLPGRGAWIYESISMFINVDTVLRTQKNC